MFNFIISVLGMDLICLQRLDRFFYVSISTSSGSASYVIRKCDPTIRRSRSPSVMTQSFLFSSSEVLWLFLFLFLIILQLYYNISLTTELFVGDFSVIQIFVPNNRTIHHNDSPLLSFSMKLNNEG